MKYLKIFIIAALYMHVTGCAHSDPWTKQDTVLQSIYTATLVIDGIQTSEIQYRRDLEEGGPIARAVLGPNPSTSDTWMYFGTLAISNYLITRALPEEWRPFWQGANIAMHGKAIISNCAHGLGSICEDAEARRNRQ